MSRRASNTRRLKNKNQTARQFAIEHFVNQELKATLTHYLKGLREISWQTFFRVCTEDKVLGPTLPFLTLKKPRSEPRRSIALLRGQTNGLSYPQKTAENRRTE